MEVLSHLQGGEPAPASDLAATARRLVAAAKAQATRRAYVSDWDHFRQWCQGQALPFLPAAPATVALYLAAHAETLKPATLVRRLASINVVHRMAGFNPPASMREAAVSEVMKGIRRTSGVAQDGKRPVLIDDVRAMAAALPGDLQGVRDRALLLMGFAGGLRRSELVALDVAGLERNADGLVVAIRRSKTDQEAAGRKIGLPFGSDPLTCPVRACEKWLEEAALGNGPLFRPINRHGVVGSGRLHAASVALIVKRAAARAGLDASGYAAHSLRAGLATQAYLNGATETSIMRQTGHRSAATLRRYIRDVGLFRDNPAAKLGL